MTKADQPSFIKALGLWDVIAMNIVAVVGLRWITRSARLGAPSVSLWILAWLVFAALLLGRARYGWRGRVALRWLLAGSVLLLLAYLGTKFVLEVLLGR